MLGIDECPNCEARDFPGEKGYDSAEEKRHFTCTTCWEGWYEDELEEHLDAITIELTIRPNSMGGTTAETEVVDVPDNGIAREFAQRIVDDFGLYSIDWDEHTSQ